jgi:hypothetical protein
VSVEEKECMRDPKRISEVLELIELIWKKDPDLRFNQLIYTLHSGYSQANDNVGKVEEVVDPTYSRIGFDLFNLEDETFIKYLRDQVSGE